MSLLKMFSENAIAAWRIVFYLPSQSRKTSKKCNRSSLEQVYELDISEF